MQGVYNRFTGDKGWRSILVRASKPAQSAEINELQSVLRDRSDRLGRGVYKDGHIVDNALLTVLPNNPDGTVSIADGRIFLDGTVIAMPGSLISPPMGEHVLIGVRHRVNEITELDDITLRDPAVGADNYQEAGAGREVDEFAWGWLADSGLSDANATWENFFPVYELESGVPIVRDIPPASDPIVAIIAKYDRESNGNYVVRGFDTTFVDTFVDSLSVLNNRFQVASGAADINGYKVERDATSLLFIPNAPSTQAVIGEPHLYSGFLSGGSEEPAPFTTIFLNKGPITGVNRVLAAVQDVSSLTKGVSGGMDELPESTIVDVISVKVLGTGGNPDTTYVRGTDWQLSGNHIDWSPAGQEPSTGTTMEVVFTYEVAIDPSDPSPSDPTLLDVINITSDAIVLKGMEDRHGLVPSQTIYIDYDYALPRKDLIVINSNGTLQVITGVSQTRNPIPPNPTSAQAALAVVSFDWRNPPIVSNVAVRAIPMNEIQRMRDQIDDLYELQAISQLRTDAGLKVPAEKKGLFVDPFTGDDRRDMGLAQDGVVVNGGLQLPVDSDAYDPNGTGAGAVLPNQWLTLNYELEVVAQQSVKTNSIKVNPFQWKGPPPPPIVIVPNITIADTTVIESASTFVNAVFQVSLDFPTTVPVRVNYSTLNGTATAPGDYVTKTGTLTFAPGEVIKLVTIKITPHSTLQADKAFSLVLSNPVGGVILDGTGVCLLVSTGAPAVITPDISIDDTIYDYGFSVLPYAGPATFQVTLSQASTSTVTVQYAAQYGSATSTVDFYPTSGTLTFAPGEVSKTISIPLRSSTYVSVLKYFYVNLTSPTNGHILIGQATCLIIPPVPVGGADKGANVYLNPPAAMNVTPPQTTPLNPTIPHPAAQPPNKPPITPTTTIPPTYVRPDFPVNIHGYGFGSGEKVAAAKMGDQDLALL